jgi:L-alanine-DL-glutamate epimerase-like enolase superfamily enzyme
MGRREFLRRLGATTVGAAGLTGMMGPFEFARAATTPGEKGIYITDVCAVTITGLNSNDTIIRIDTNKGISGYGEARCEDTNALTELKNLKSIVIGMNPTQVDKVFNAIKNYGNPTSNPTNLNQITKTGGICAIENACWDITGKVYNVPVWKLIGPKLRDYVQLYCDTSQQSSTSALQSVLTSRLNAGFKWIKLDIQKSMLTSGTDYTTSPETSLPYTCWRLTASGLSKFGAYIAAGRSTIGPNIPISTDHYQGWGSTNYLDITSAIALSNLMAGSAYQNSALGGWMEDIWAWWYPTYLKQINDGTDMPILTGEDMYGIDQFKTLVDAGAVNYIHPDPSTAGGIHQSRLAGQYAWEHGVRTALHCSGSPFAFVACLHIAAGLPNFLALEHHYIDLSWWQNLVDGIEKPILNNSSHPGYAAVPEGPGLGITPNETTIRAHLSGSYFASLT